MSQTIDTIDTGEGDNPLVLHSGYMKLLLIKHKDRDNPRSEHNIQQSGMAVFDVRFTTRDVDSLTLELYSVDVAFDLVPKYCYVLDIQARVLAEVITDPDNANQLRYVHFSYQRERVTAKFKIVPVTAQEIEELRAFDFLLAQYTYYDNIQVLRDADAKNAKSIPLVGQEREANLLAKGLESSGTVVRSVLKSGGKRTGDVIRFLGNKYTDVTVSSHKLMYGEVKPFELSEQAVERAKLNKQRAEAVHAGARSLTSALLFPVRWIGRKASEQASRGHEDGLSQASAGRSGAGNTSNNTAAAAAAITSSGSISSDYVFASSTHNTGSENSGTALSSSSAASSASMGELGYGQSKDSKESVSAASRTALMDTLGGVGNAVMHVCKGVTEALGEIGTAVGDVTLQHSTTINGAEYADRVTKHYVDAGSEIGLAGFKVANVASFGIYGLMLDAAVEGATMFVCLPDYLVGPVLLQGYMDMQMLPKLDTERFFVVLRPFSVSFYKQASQILQKPFKILITSMLDTLPRLRHCEHIIKMRQQFMAILPNEEAFASDDDDEDNAGDAHGVEQSSEGEALLTSVTRRSSAGNSSGPSAATSKSTMSVDSDIITYLPANEELGCDAVGDVESSQPLIQSVSDLPFLRNEQDLEQLEGTEVTDHISAPQDTQRIMQHAKLKKRGILDKLRGSQRPHIEVCTVDCSSYLLFPEPAEELIFMWYEEIKKASLRVETVGKKKSGAEEVALNLRLSRLPKAFTVSVQIKYAILDPSYEEIGPDGAVKVSDAAAEDAESLDDEFDAQEELALMHVAERTVDAAATDEDGLALRYGDSAASDRQQSPQQRLYFEPALWMVPSSHGFVEEAPSPRIRGSTASVDSVNNYSVHSGGDSNSDDEDNSTIPATVAEVVDTSRAVSGDGIKSLPVASEVLYSADDVVTEEDTVTVQGEVTSQPPKKSSKPSPFSLSALRSATIGQVLEPMRNLTLGSLKVRVVPLTDKGLYVKGECHLSHLSDVKKHPYKGLAVSEMLKLDLAASIPELEQMLLAIYGEKDITVRVSSWEDELIEVGQTYTVSSADCKFLTFTLQGKLPIGGTVEVGRGRIRIEDITGEPRNVWVPLMHKTSRRRVGYVQVNTWVNFK